MEISNYNEKAFKTVAQDSGEKLTYFIILLKFVRNSQTLLFSIEENKYIKKLHLRIFLVREAGSSFLTFPNRSKCDRTTSRTDLYE
jgi:hypothetical protein